MYTPVSCHCIFPEISLSWRGRHISQNISGNAGLPQALSEQVNASPQVDQSRDEKSRVSRRGAQEGLSPRLVGLVVVIRGAGRLISHADRDATDHLKSRASSLDDG